MQAIEVQSGAFPAFDEWFLRKNGQSFEQVVLVPPTNPSQAVAGLLFYARQYLSEFVASAQRIDVSISEVERLSEDERVDVPYSLGW